MNRLLTCVAVAGIAGVLFLGSTCGLLNKPPSVPEISGPTTGIVGVPVTFTATATDPEGDSIAFQFAWGDGDTSDWSALFASGETTTLSHAYADTGSYSVSARAKDAAGNEPAPTLGHPIKVVEAGPGHPDTVVGEIGTPRNAFKGVVTPDGRLLYVTHYDEDFVSCIRLSDRTVLDSITVGRDPRELVMDPAGGYVYVHCQDDSILVKVRVSDNAVLDTVHLGANLQGVAVSPDGQLIYSACGGSAELYVTRASDMVLVDSVRLSSSPADVVLAPDGSEAYVSLLMSKVAVVKLPELEVQAEVITADFPGDMVVSPDGGTLYAETQGDSGLAVIPTDTREVIVTVRISGKYYDDLVMMPGGAYALVTDGTGIRFVDTRANRLAGTVAYPGGWGGLAVRPSGDTVYVLANRHVYVVGVR